MKQIGSIGVWLFCLLAALTLFVLSAYLAGATDYDSDHEQRLNTGLEASIRQMDLLASEDWEPASALSEIEGVSKYELIDGAPEISINRSNTDLIKDEPKQSSDIPMTKIEVLNAISPDAADTLIHINLMLGNSVSDDDLIESLVGTTELSPDVYVRIPLVHFAPDTYNSLKHYEQHVLGELVEPTKIKEVVNSREFIDYKDYLIASGLVVTFCSQNPNNLSCINDEIQSSQKEITKLLY